MRLAADFLFPAIAPRNFVPTLIASAPENGCGGQQAAAGAVNNGGTQNAAAGLGGAGEFADRLFCENFCFFVSVFGPGRELFPDGSVVRLSANRGRGEKNQFFHPLPGAGFQQIPGYAVVNGIQLIIRTGDIDEADGVDDGTDLFQDGRTECGM